MKTTNLGKRRTWRQVVKNPEVWQCVPAGKAKDYGVTPLAFVSEHVRQTDGKSYFVYEVDTNTGWEMRRREAMKRAEDVLDSIKR